MDKLLFTAVSGATRVITAQQVLANNLANVNTDGFRADIGLAKSVEIQGKGLETRTLTGIGSTWSDFTPGALKRTDNPLDVAIRGNGFFAVQVGEDGEAYTRAGAFHLNENGDLMLGDRPVLGEGGPIAIPEHEKLMIGQDGTISVVTAGSAAVQEVGKLKLVKPEPNQLRKGEDGLFRTYNGEPVDADQGVTVAVGYLESSNVNAIDALVKNIDLSRNFEFQIKMMKTAEELASTGNRLVRGN
ncbi:flagellar basal body rod protein FlgF [Grimontia hollisae]|uniref:flagellar basal body rod protein FlgF n=1 Tax=Grimontia hollisae TaxID=673 RepID=UPI0012AC5F7A|nr:flagellar basal body rod protein FlgF [Grimontia hollisae]